MSRFKKILKCTLVVIFGLIISLFALGYWFIGLIPRADAESDLSQTTPNSLSYLSKNQIEKRGRILAVVTSTETMGSSGKATGYELTELSRAYYVFLANGFEVDVASPKGGEPPVIIDDEDMGVYDYAFLNDSIAQHKTKHTLAMAEVDPSLYSAIYFVGGKGAMYDFPDNPHIQSIVSSYYESGRVIGAVCHGPAALVNVKLTNGQSLVDGMSVSSFTNREELFLIPKAKVIFPFLLEDKLKESGAKFDAGGMYLENVVHDHNLITGQNPWSTWKLAETMISQMGYQPKTRLITAEENAIQIIGTHQQNGYDSAKTKITEMAINHLDMNRTIIAMHSIVSAMRFKLIRAFELAWLLKHAKDAFDKAGSLSPEP